MRILVTGGRDFINSVFLRQVLDAYLDNRLVIIHGACPTGADNLADYWAHWHGVPVLPYPADWKNYGASAGPRRNQKMLDEAAPDLVLAFHGPPRGKRTGTEDMVERALAAGVPVIQYAHGVGQPP